MVSSKISAGLLLGLLTAVPVSAQTALQEAEAQYYKMITFPFDESMPLEVGAMTCLEDGRLLIGTRRGDVFKLENPYVADPKKARFSLWTRGLAQPLGFAQHLGWIYTAQRGELTRMKDSNGDGKADIFETVCDDWEISGNYHEYNFGPRIDPKGQMWITINKPFGGEPYGKAHWRGWAVTVDPTTGVMKPIATGLRSPAGVEVSPWGDAFYTDNQGEWCNASKLSHIEYGEFHGHPHGLHSKKKAGEPFASMPEPVSGTYMREMHKQIPSFKMPAVWFPYDKMGKSPSGMVWDQSKGGFGPFSGQLFVADQHHASVMRVCLEEVDGHWQGACFPFREGFDCGITRVCWGKDNSLFVGMTNSGWGGKGTKPWGLQRLVWTGTTPFEIKTMSVRPKGFLLTFTKPVNSTQAAELSNYRGESYTYKLQSRYGGPEDDKLPLSIESAEVSEDGLSVLLTITPLRSGYVHELHLKNISARDGSKLLHPVGYYTLIKQAH